MADIEITRVPRIDVKKAGTLVGTRPAINLIEGSNVTLTVADDSAGNEVDVTIAASGGSATPSDFQPAIVTNKYYNSKLISGFNGASPVAGQLVAYPIWFSHTETWTRIGTELFVGSGSATEKMRLGIYADSGGYPGALVLDAGEIALQTSGEKELTISQSLTANTVYWLAQNTNDASGFTSVSGDGSSMFSGNLALSSWLFGNNPSLDYSSGPKCYYRTLAYAALPDPFGTPDGIITDSGSGTGMAAIWLRKV